MPAQLRQNRVGARSWVCLGGSFTVVLHCEDSWFELSIELSEVTTSSGLRIKGVSNPSPKLLSYDIRHAWSPILCAGTGVMR